MIDTPNAVSFNTQPPEGGCSALEMNVRQFIVSTHSRLKAAAPPLR